MALTLEVNGKSSSVAALPDTPLLYVLRNDLGLNDAKYGCGFGQCGACTVLDVQLIDRPDERPLGVGEGSQGPTAAAIANAFANATGRRLRDLPLAPERVKAVLA